MKVTIKGIGAEHAPKVLGMGGKIAYYDEDADIIDAEFIGARVAVREMYIAVRVSDAQGRLVLYDTDFAYMAVT